jgi:hypothetical protein
MKASPIKFDEIDMKGLLTSLALMTLTTGQADASCEERHSRSQIEMYPSARELPSNLLRVYLYFPYPVKSENILEHITLKDSHGRPVEGGFLSNRYDLWSPDRRRLTLLFDPGRVKTGLRAHETLGRALIPGEGYSLVINQTWLQKTDCLQESDTVFEFSVVAPDYNPPKPNEWIVTPPTAGTLDPLTVDLGSPHDHISLAYRLRVKDEQGLVVAGSIKLGRNESVWHFTPTNPWPSSKHHLIVDELLEDLAGNRPSGLFDRPSEDAPLTWTDELLWHPS